METLLERKRELSFKFNLGICLAVSLLGGLLVSFADLSMTLLGKEWSSFHYLLRLSLVIAALYAVIGALGMAIFGSLIFLLLRIGEYRLDRNQLIGLQIGLFILLASSVITSDLLEVKSAFVNAGLWYLLVFSILPAVGAGALSVFVLSCYSFKRISWFGFAGLFALSGILFAGLGWSTQIQAPRLKLPEALSQGNRPNILWIILDTARADHFSSYGYNKSTTPEIDRIAKEGVLFQNAISPAPWTVPSHASMLTGLFPSRHGTDADWRWLGNEFVTIAEVLKERGWHTIGISNNHNFGSTTNLSQGFDPFVQLRYWSFQPPNNNLMLVRALKKIQKTLENHLKIPVLDRLILFLTYDLDLRYDGGAQKTNQLVQCYLRKLAERGAPFFMFINYMDVHESYGDTPSARRRSSQKRKEADQIVIDRDDLFAGAKKIREDEISLITDLYDDDLSYLDLKVGELVNYLKDLGILDNTLLIITSDHGENLGDHNRVGHIYDIHHTLLHVPLIVRYPNAFPQGRVEKRLVQTTDLFPTILELAGIKDFPKGDIQGYSLLEANRPSQAISEARFKENWLDNRAEIARKYPGLDLVNFVGGDMKNIHDGDYEFMVSSRGKALYDLRQDPQESRDLTVANPDRAGKLRDQLKTWLSSFSHYWELQSEKSTGGESR